MTLIDSTLLPNVFIPGAGKSGTSSLHNYLNMHPDISMSKIKEPHFWTNPNFKNYNNIDFKQYSNLFNADCKYRGESSTGYLFFEDFVENLKSNSIEKPKFIVLLRNPIDRIYSHYWWLKGIGSETSKFRAAVLKDMNIIPNQSLQLAEQHYKNYFQFGLYGKNIDRFYTAFGKENIHIITTENLHKNTLRTINSCFHFLGLRNLEKAPDLNINRTKILRFPWIYKNVKKMVLGKSKFKKIIKPFFPRILRNELNKNLYPLIYKLTSTSKKYPEIETQDREWLQGLYLEDVRHLKQITGLDFNEWRDFNSI